jgi:hypothetical protein
MVDPLPTGAFAVRAARPGRRPHGMTRPTYRLLAFTVTAPLAPEALPAAS